MALPGIARNLLSRLFSALSAGALPMYRYCTRRRSGEVAGFITTYTDITERRHTEEAQERQTRILQTILDNIPGGVSLIDGNLQLMACNEELKRLLDFPPELFADGLPSLETLFRFNAQRGEYGPGDPDQLVAELRWRTASNAAAATARCCSCRASRCPTAAS